MPSQAEIDQHLQLLDRYRNNLRILLEQEAQHGGKYQSPLSLLNQIQESRFAIARIKQVLRSWRAPVEDEVMDEDMLNNAAVQATSVAKGQTMQQKSWVPITVALIGLLGVVIAAIFNSGFLKPQSSEPFIYQVRVQDSIQSNAIVGAKVTVELSNVAPLDEFTDNNGLVVMNIDGSMAGRLGKVIVEANKYKRFEQNITLSAEALPKTIRLESVN